MFPRKKTNPKHPNAGKIGNFNQDRTRHLSFANFTISGFVGNLQTAANLLSSDVKDANWTKLPIEERGIQLDFAQRLHILALEAKDLAEDIAEFNRDKTKLDLSSKEKTPDNPSKPRKTMRLHEWQL
jgi:hypothetical protein